MKIDSNEPKINYPLRRLIRDLYEYIGPNKKQFWWGTGLRVVSDVSSLYYAIALSIIVDVLAGAKPHPFSFVVLIGILWLVAALIRVVTQYYSKIIIFRLSEATKNKVELKYLRALFARDSSWHESENAGNKFKRIENGAEGVNTILRTWIENIIEIVINFIGMIFILAHYDATIAILCLIFISTFSIISIRMLRPAVRASQMVNASDEMVSGTFFEAIGNIRTVKVLNIWKTLLGHAKQALDEKYARIKVRIDKFQIRFSTLSLYGNFFMIATVVFISFQITEGKYEIGFLILFYNYFNRLWDSVKELSNVSQDIVVSKQRIARMRDSFHDIPLINSEEVNSFPKDWQKLIVKNVSFSYDEDDVLKNVSFEVKRGEKIGIVGTSGAGKSTLFKLLLKERIHADGEIKIDDTLISTIKTEEYLARVSVVLQDTEVFNQSLKENITIVRPEEAHDKKLFDETLQISHVKDFVSKLKDGVNTLIGEKGVKLSGGERQRLGIARAIFKEPDILLMDEATSHLDIESEKKIQDSLHEFFQNVTAIVIAHRLTTIKLMDKILVIEKGKIIEQGSFDELYAKRGRFHELWEKQQL